MSRSPAKAKAAVDDVRQELESLRNRISEHFRSEERGGPFDEIADEFPRLRERVRSLYKEHGELLRRIDSICRMASKPGAWKGDGLREAFVEFAEDVRRHEREENELVSEAYLSDIGTGD